MMSRCISTAQTSLVHICQQNWKRIIVYCLVLVLVVFYAQAFIWLPEKQEHMERHISMNVHDDLEQIVDLQNKQYQELVKKLDHMEWKTNNQLAMAIAQNERHEMGIVKDLALYGEKKLECGSVEDDSPVRVGVFLPVTSKDGPPHVKESYLLKAFLLSFVETATPSHHYIVYIAYDIGDPMFDDEQNQVVIKNTFYEAIVGAKLNVQVRLVLITGKIGVIGIWNTLSQYVMKDCLTVVISANDDLKFITKNWSDLAYQQLAHLPIPFLGIVAFLDRNNERIPTFSLVSRKHFEIFGIYHMSSDFWAWCDPLIQSTYELNKNMEGQNRGQTLSVWRDDIVMENYQTSNESGSKKRSSSRYDYTGGGKTYSSDLRNQRLQLFRYLKREGLLLSWMPRTEAEVAEIPLDMFSMHGYTHYAGFHDFRTNKNAQQ